MQELQRQQSLARRLGANPEADTPKKFVIEVLVFFTPSYSTRCMSFCLHRSGCGGGDVCSTGMLRIESKAQDKLSQFPMEPAQVYTAQQCRAPNCYNIVRTQLEVAGIPLHIAQAFTNLEQDTANVAGTGNFAFCSQ